MYILDEKNEDTRLLHQEWNILQICAHFEKLMEQKNISRKQLSDRLGTDKSYVTKILDGANLTIRKITDVLLALDSSLSIDTIAKVELITNIPPISQIVEGMDNILKKEFKAYSETPNAVSKTRRKKPDLIERYSKCLDPAA